MAFLFFIKIIAGFLCNFYAISLLFCAILGIFSLLFCVKIWKLTFKLYNTAFKLSICQLSNPAFKPSIIVYVSVCVCRYAGMQVSMYPCIQLSMYTIIHNHNARLINFTNLHHKIICRKILKNVLTYHTGYCILINVKRVDKQVTMIKLFHMKQTQNAVLSARRAERIYHDRV